MGRRTVEQKAGRRGARFIYLSASVAPSLTRARSGHAGRRVAWRVLAANNRPLGRSVTVYNTLGDCTAAASELHRDVSRAVGSIGFETGTGSWRWTLSLGGAAAATCVNPYGRRIECQRALAQFLVAVADAEPGAQQVRHLGIGALHDYDHDVCRELARRAVD